VKSSAIIPHHTTTIVACNSKKLISSPHECGGLPQGDAMIIGLDTVLGYIGLTLVFASFVVKRWEWLYAFNMSGAIILSIYAFIKGEAVFFILQTGIAIFLAYRLVNELKRTRR